MGLIEIYKDQIHKLCKNHGSVNTPKFSTESDVDLMVDFEISDPIEYTENYFDLKFELERILNRSIDLLESKAIKNPFLRENIDKSKILFYEQ